MADIKIYFDMDGVLADFDNGVRAFCHREPLVQGKCTPSETDVLWDAVRFVPHFYAKLEPIPGSIDMVRDVYEKLGDRCQILTGVPKPRRMIDHASKDKVEWIRRYVSDSIIVNTVFREEKKNFCHGPADILVDDYAKNIREWERNGGMGILFTNAAETLEEIQAYLG